MTETANSNIGRNEPCPCGSGKKYKRCCGVSAAPKISPPKAGGMANNPLANMDPAMMAQMSQMLGRMPKGQVQRLQGLMQKAMAGKDISNEAADFEKLMPVEMQELMRTMGMQMAAQMGQENAAAEESSDMTPEQAREIVAQAAASGKITDEKAKELLTAETQSPEAGGISKFFRGLKKGK